jgi:hypothetical protein
MEQYYGVDECTGFPCLKPFKIQSESAENVLITAETSGGRCFRLKGNSFREQTSNDTTED